MKKNLAVMAGLIASTALLMAASPAMAAHVDVGVNIGLPGVYVQPAPVYVQERPVYVRPEYEQDWHERHARARDWREHQGRDDRHDRRDAHDDHHDRGEHRGHDD